MITPQIIAKNLLEIKAVTLSPNDPYTWASGIKSPIYCDNRLTLSSPKSRDIVIDGYIELIKKEFSDSELIAGVATSGIPYASIIADKLNLPLVYVRANAKDHGKGATIEGMRDGLESKKTVVIEDLISTGGSVIEAIKTMEESKFANILGVAAIFTYQMKKGYEKFQEANYQYQTLSNYQVLIEEALEIGYIKPQELELLKTWHKQFE